MALNWKVNSLTTSTEGSLSNVVSHVEWECTFITESVCRRSYGRVKLQTSHLNDEGQSFTEFEDLSEDNTFVGIQWTDEEACLELTAIDVAKALLDS